MSAAVRRPLVLLGYGAIGKSALGMMKVWNKGEVLKKLGASSVTVLSDVFSDHDKAQLTKWDCNVVEKKLTHENFRDVLTPLFTGHHQKAKVPALVVNLTVGVNSLDLVKVAQDAGALFIDTSASEMWPHEEEETVAENFGEIGSNYWCRERLLDWGKTLPAGSPTALCCMGANPGIVSLFAKSMLDKMWMVKTERTPIPTDTDGRHDFARMAEELGVRVVHVSERDTQQAIVPRPPRHFTNTWSIDGFILEGIKQCADIGWGTHEKQLPKNGHHFTFGCGAAIRIAEPSAGVRVLSYVPTFGEQVAACVAHYETSSLAQYLTRKEKGKVVYRPTVHYAYRCCDDALACITEIEEDNWNPDYHTHKHVYLPEELTDGGADELGVLMMTNQQEAGTYWYGSTVYTEEARRIAPYCQSTSIQVASGVLSGALWLVRNPKEGLCEPENIHDYERVLDDARPFLGKMHFNRTAWTPRGGDPTDDKTWQFDNLRMTGKGYSARSKRIHHWGGPFAL